MEFEVSSQSRDSENGCLRRKAERVNHVWSYDVVSDQTADGRRLKLLVVLDEYTRESLTIEVERGIRGEAVRSTLEYLFAVRGTPQYLRSDSVSVIWAVRERCMRPCRSCRRIRCTTGPHSRARGPHRAQFARFQQPYPTKI